MFTKNFLKTAMTLKKAPLASSKPLRVTPTIKPGNPVFGLKGLTGAGSATFNNPVNRFGTTARKGLVSRTSAVRGIKI